MAQSLEVKEEKMHVLKQCFNLHLNILRPDTFSSVFSQIYQKYLQALGTKTNNTVTKTTLYPHAKDSNKCFS